jgi:hypothetical protein
MSFYFIIDYYINQNENSIQKKHKLILNNQDYIEQLFEIWKINVNLTMNQSCIFIIP